MKAVCLQENLNKGLSVLGRIISGKTQLPILGDILITTEQNLLRLAATNLETGINFRLGAKIEKEGGLAVPAKNFAELVSSFPAEKVELEVEADILKVSCGGHKASLNGLPAREFPSFSLPNKKSALFFAKESFLQAVSMTAFAAAQDEGRPVLTGVKWEKGAEELSLAATDGYRLSLQKIPFKGAPWGENLIIPARALLEVAHIMQEKNSGEEKEVKMFVAEEEGQIGFSLDNIEITTRLIEGEFPEFSKIIPQEFGIEAVLGKKELLGAIKVVSIFARDSANIVKWNVGKDKIRFSANSPQVGEGNSEIEAKVSGGEGEVAFNFRYLLDFLGAVKGEEIVFGMSGPLNPGFFKLKGDDSFLHIIMPVRVQG